MRWKDAIGPLQRRFRRQRAERILARFPEINGSTVVDIGGALTFWKGVEDILKPARIIIYNIHDGRMKMGEQARSENIELHIYDGTTIPQEDGFADFVLCNSVIEHVPLDARENLASEIKRVGKQYIVQTPAREFPIELHFGMPFIHWLPRKLGRAIVPVSPFGILSQANAQEYFDQTQLLGRKEFEQFFPDAKIELERVAGIPKSMLALG